MDHKLSVDQLILLMRIDQEHQLLSDWPNGLKALQAYGLIQVEGQKCQPDAEIEIGRCWETTTKGEELVKHVAAEACWETISVFGRR